MKPKEYIRILLLRMLKSNLSLENTVIVKMIFDELDKI